jgi:hypothetical protein
VRAERLIEPSRTGGADEGGAREGEVASTAGVGAGFSVFAQSDSTVNMLGAFDAPATGAAGEPLAAGGTRHA